MLLARDVMGLLAVATFNKERPAAGDAHGRSVNNAILT